MTTSAATRNSTIVRLIPPWLLRLSQLSFGTLERLAPGLAGRWALRLWLSPPRLRSRQPFPRTPPSPSSRRFTVQLNLPPGRRRSATAGQILAETWGSGPVVYLLHGWGGNRSHLIGLVAPLVAAGMQVVSLDAPGHGDSGSGRHGGRRTTLPEIAAAFTAVTAVTGPPYAVVAHSGGCTVAGLAVRDGLAVNRLVFISPMSNPMTMFGQFSHLLGLGPRSRQRFRRSLEHAAGRQLTEFDLVAQATEADQLPPLLVIHDRDDRQLPHAQGRAIADAWPGARLITTTGLGHLRLLADPEVISAAVAHVTGRGR